MASCITEAWVKTAPQIKLTVTQESSTDTVVTLKWVLQYVAASPASASARPYKAVVNGKTVAEGDYAINGKTGTYTIDSDTVYVTKGSSTKTVSFSCSMEFCLTWSGSYRGTMSASGSISIPGISAYTVKYDANGGSSAPSSQTKMHGVNLELSSTIPTRTGYTFQGWATSSDSTTVGYGAGATYASDASITLYAVWKANTYTIKYYANGGSGAPASQTKTHGVGLKLATAEPTRTNYTFLGWGLSASATTVSYESGATYTANADLALYAIWSLAYTPPRITNLTMGRCDADGNLDESGTAMLTYCEWACDNAGATITMKWRESASTEWESMSGSDASTQGTLYLISPEGVFDADITYILVLTVSDGIGETSVSRTVAGARFMLDFMDENKGAAVGKAAEVEGVFDIGFQTRFMGGILHPVLETGADLDTVMTPNTYILTSGREYANAPEENVGAVLDVIGASSRLQRYTVISKTDPRSYERAWYSDAWGEWQEVTRDTGWLNADLASEFVVYDSTAANKVRYRRVGKQVEIRGGVTPNVDGIGGDTSQHIIFTLPEGFRPSSTLYWRCQGSNCETWMLSVTSGGEVRFARYGDGMAMFPAYPGTWLPFQANFFID